MRRAAKETLKKVHIVLLGKVLSAAISILVKNMLLQEGQIEDGEGLHGG